MKFSFKKLLVSGVLAGAMTFCAAGAANFDSAAQSLSDLGLLNGTQSGFDLDRAGTRGEAAAMLVRLLGKEAEAVESWKTDAEGFAFTDMEDSAWAKPYVNWLVKNGLAAGTTDTTFAPRDECSAQMAATFLLRALGYSDAEGGDFTYFTAMDFAREKGVVDLFNCDEKAFQRDHLVAMCYTTLSRQPKSGEADLLSKLVAEGVVADNDASKALRQNFADYREFYGSSDNLNNATSMACKLTADFNISAEGESAKMSMVQDIAMKYDAAKPADMEMSVTGSVSVITPEETVNVPNTMYFKDGYAYIEADGTKIKLPMDFEEAISQAGVINVKSVNGEPITSIESLKKSTADGKTTYDIVYNAKLMNHVVDSIMGPMLQALPELGGTKLDISIDKVTLHSVTANGKVESAKMDMAMSFGEEDFKMDMNMTMDITAVGDGVKVEFPASFEGYESIEE